MMATYNINNAYFWCVTRVTKPEDHGFIGQQ